MCGANCMGFVNFEHGLRAMGFATPVDIGPGPVAWISHSGSAFTALLHNDRGLRFGLAVSSGRSSRPRPRTTSPTRWAARDPGGGAPPGDDPRPRGFRSALDTRPRPDVAVVALKVGREPAAREMVAAHSGALAGEDGVLDAVFEAHGVARGARFGDLAETVELFSSPRRAPGTAAASPPCTTPAASARTSWMWPPGPASRSRGSPARRSRAGRDVWNPACRPRTRSTRGGPASTTSGSSSSASGRCATIPTRPRWRSWSTWRGEELEQGYTRVAIEVSRERRSRSPCCRTCRPRSTGRRRPACGRAAFPCWRGRRPAQALRPLLDDARFRSREVGRRAPARPKTFGRTGRATR